MLIMSVLLVTNASIGDYSIEYSLRLDLGARAVWTVFIRSFNAATYDITEDKRGMLFQRLVDHGPPNPDGLEMQFSDNGIAISDPALGHMYSCPRVEMREVEDYGWSDT